MLKKCLKYDLKAVWPIWWIVALAVLGAGLIGCVSIRGLIEITNYELTHDSTVFTIVGVITLGFVGGIAGFAQIAFLTVSPILVYVRFYRNFFTDEGYLTFTLPVKRRDLYLAKVLNAVIWDCGAFVVVAIVELFGMLVIPPTSLQDMLYGTGQLGTVVGPFNLIAFETIGQALTAIWEDVGGWLIVYILEILLMLAGAGLFGIGLIHMCITFGSVIARKHKLIASIGVYVGVTTVLSIVSEVIFFISLIMMMEGAILLLSALPAGQICGVAALVLLLVCVIVAILDVIMHYLALGNLEKRLNLA